MRVRVCAMAWRNISAIVSYVAPAVPVGAPLLIYGGSRVHFWLALALTQINTVVGLPAEDQAYQATALPWL